MFGAQFGAQYERHWAAVEDRKPSKYGGPSVRGTLSLGLWFRRSRVRSPSLTLEDPVVTRVAVTVCGAVRHRLGAGFIGLLLAGAL